MRRLCGILLFGIIVLFSTILLLPVSNALADSTFDQVYAGMQRDYPEGMTWTNENSSGQSWQAWGCWAYANIFGERLFGSIPARDWGGYHTDRSRIVVGDIISTDTDADFGHTMVVVDVDGDTLTIAEGNGANGQIHYGRTFGRYTYTLRIYHAPNYDDVMADYGNKDPYGALDEIRGGKETIYVRGWVKDDDAPGQSLDVHIYVGGEAGSGASCYVIKANKSRPDAGGNYGFEATINVRETARQNVYLYAINQPVGNNPCIVQTTAIIPPRNAILIDEVNFPDEKFREYVRQYDIDSLGYLLEEDLADVTTMSFWYYYDLTSLKGIEFFTALKEIKCVYTGITGELDLNNNIALERIEIEYSKLTALNISGCTQLNYLNCYDNQITNLDVGNCMQLVELNCSCNQISSLDVSKNTELIMLDCSENKLSSIGVSKNTKLETLKCGNNSEIKELDVSKNRSLKVLSFCYTNISEIDVSDNTELEELVCYACNNLRGLDVSHNFKLKILNAYFCELITELDVRNNKELIVLNCLCDRIRSLDVSQNTKLEELNCFQNIRLTELDVTHNPALVRLNCGSNYISSLDLSNNHKITWFRCEGNVMTNLDISPIKSVDSSCAFNQNAVSISSPYDLSNLPGHFDINRASDWVGGTVEGTILTATDSVVTYKYDIGKGVTVDFRLNIIASPQVYLPEGLVYIESDAFKGTGARRFYIPETVQYIAEDAFDNGTAFYAKPGSYALRRGTELLFNYNIYIDTIGYIK